MNGFKKTDLDIIWCQPDGGVCGLLKLPVKKNVFCESLAPLISKKQEEKIISFKKIFFKFFSFLLKTKAYPHTSKRSQKKAQLPIDDHKNP